MKGESVARAATAIAAATTTDTAMVPAASRQTPMATVEAVMWAVRERGLNALKEPACRERLSQCDDAAQAQIIQRVEKLHAAGRLPGGDVDV
jgi:hypothetical protein